MGFSLIQLALCNSNLCPSLRFGPTCCSIQDNSCLQRDAAADFIQSHSDTAYTACSIEVKTESPESIVCDAPEGGGAYND